MLLLKITAACVALLATSSLTHADGDVDKLEKSFQMQRDALVDAKIRKARGEWVCPRAMLFCLSPV